MFHFILKWSGKKLNYIILYEIERIVWANLLYEKELIVFENFS